MRLDGPLITETRANYYPEPFLTQALNQDMASLRDLGAYDEIEAELLTKEQKRAAINAGWALRWKELELKARLCAKGYSQNIDDKHETYASTLLITTLIFSRLLSIVHGWKTLQRDVSNAFLHAQVDEKDFILLEAPEAYYPGKQVYWGLRKLLYGLNTAPKGWQDHFASVVESE